MLMVWDKDGNELSSDVGFLPLDDHLNPLSMR
jgi:hypothetical protein